ncbi:MAG: hypothetical protein LBN27_13140 [Prevotellaceae bacterium]|nr:hypothetical protein [Prevotellaceae bacterium]
MVFYSEEVYDDFDDIFDALLSWKDKKTGQKHMNYYEVADYIDRMQTFCETIDKAKYHFRTQYEYHKRYGGFYQTYKPNSRTIWYVIYNVDVDIYINKIMNNYLTIK